MSTLLTRIIGREMEEEIPEEIADEIRDDGTELAPDPPPAPRSSSFTLLSATTAGKVTPALKKRISAELEAYIEMAALPIVMRDPECGGALHDQAKPIADAVAQILSRYPDIAHKFMATGVLGDWLKLLMVCTPVLKAVYGHHIAPQPLETSADDGLDLPPNFDPFRPGT